MIGVPIRIPWLLIGTHIRISLKVEFLCNQFEFLTRGVIGEVRCGFLRIYAPTPYSAVFLLHAPAPVFIKIGFGAVWFGLVRCVVGAALRFGLNSFGSD